MELSNIIEGLRDIAGSDSVIREKESLITYESDGLTMDKAVPWAVVFAESAKQVSDIVKYLSENKIPFTPRGAGTGLSGGCLPVEGGIVISLTRMNSILEIDIENRIAVVEPGVLNQSISDAVKDDGLYFSPDPSSGQASTIGGNIAENAGGPHTMKYGVTVNHVMGLEVVLPDGDIVELGSRTLETQGYDLVGLMNGSEGTFGIVTKAIVKLIPLPETHLTFCGIFNSIDGAVNTITQLFRAGITPVALELIDKVYLKGLNKAFDMDFPTDAEAVMIMELDGLKAGMETLKERVIGIGNENDMRDVEIAADSEKRKKLWTTRKHATAALGRMTPFYYTQDGVVPRTRLPIILKKIRKIAKKYDITIANAFHAGDGNIHPVLMYDERIPGEKDRVLQASAEILKACVELGGTISGEHGIGSEKKKYMKLVFTDDDLNSMKDLKSVFDPEGFLNPGKIFPDEDN
ncbi:MAG: FAD-binding protein [bacterium]|nr:FAD-binding protein [bacterium]